MPDLVIHAMESKFDSRDEKWYVLIAANLNVA